MATTPLMGLSLPTPTVTPGPEWAGQLNTALTTIDSHDHSSGKGTKVTPLGLNINSDLSIGSNNLNSVKSIRFTNQSAVLEGASDLRSLYVYNNNLYFNTNTGTAVRIITGEFIDGGSLGGLTANRVAVSDGTGALVSSSVTTTTLGYLDATSSVQTQLDSKIAASTLTTDGDFLVRLSGSPSRLAIGSANTVLRSDGSTPSWGQIVNADIDASAAISRSKVATGAANHVIINDGLGVMSSEATLAKSRGGAGADMSSVTFPSSGVIVTEAGTQTLTNKTLTNAVLDGTLTGTAIKDEDDMASNSATAVPTQRSVKAYVDAQVVAASTFPTGMTVPFAGATAPPGWVLCSGRTIGNASSGATERANPDTEALFTQLWNDFSNTVLPIQDSTGAASTRGASAAADYAANKRLPVPDMRGRTFVGLDTMGGSAAGRMTSAGSGVDGTTLGASGGAQTHTLTIAQMPSHTHTQNAHTHGFVWSSLTDGVNGSGLYLGSSTQILRSNPTGNRTVSDSVQSTTATNQNTGGGDAHNNTQPSIIFNCIIKL